jgi:LytS/YehU family sensor histidine kinase
MNTSSTFTTAILRGVYVAVVVGLIAGLSAYKVDHQTTSDIITGLLAGLGALGIRGGVEGVVDANRQAKGAVSPSDVSKN